MPFSYTIFKGFKGMALKTRTVVTRLLQRLNREMRT